MILKIYTYELSSKKDLRKSLLNFIKEDAQV